MKPKTRSDKPETPNRVGSMRLLDAEPATRPPLGVMPEWLWREKRMWEIIHALHRHSEAMHSYPTEWLEELHARVGDVLQHKSKASNDSSSGTPPGK
jgi:hypothetical protein